MIQVIEYEPGMKIEPPCFIANMPMEDYHNYSEGISSSGLKAILISPAHFRYMEPYATTRAQEMGTAIHTALLEPERFKSEYLALREVTDRRASAYKEAIKVHPKEKVLTGLEADKVIGMQESVLSNDAIKSLFTAEGWRELSLFVRHPDTGAIVRCRYDLITATGVAIDLKKTRDARPDAFSRAILNYEYDLQAALYADAFEWATGERIDLFFAAVEESMPHGVKLYRPDDTVLSEGRRKYKEGLQIFADSESAGDWPNLECTEPELIGLPAWRVNQIENELLEAIE